MAYLRPQFRIDAREQVLSGRVPGPAQIGRQLPESGQPGRQVGGSAKSQNFWRVPVPSSTFPSSVMRSPLVFGVTSTLEKFFSKMSKPAMAGIRPMWT